MFQTVYRMGNDPKEEDDLRWNTTFDGRRLLKAVQTGNRISRDGRNVRGIMHVRMYKKMTFVGKDD